MNKLKIIRGLLPCKQSRFFSSQKDWREVSLPVPWGEIRGKWWGPTNIRPVLSLHGWQDNCGTFNPLIPLLDKNISFLTIDLPGHGFSTHLPPGASYDYVPYLLTIKYIKRHMNWSKLYLMGHSVGGATCSSYTMLYPNEVDFLICFDVVKPYVFPGGMHLLTPQFDEFIKSTDYKINGNEPPAYTLEEIKIRMRESLANSIAADAVHHLVERGAYPSKLHPDKYCFSRDVTLKAKMVQMNQAELVKEANKIKCPFFITKGKSAPYYENKKYFHEVLEVVKKSSVALDFHYVEGTHHVHLNNPQDELASLLSTFLKKHFKANKIEIRNDIFINDS